MPKKLYIALFCIFVQAIIGMDNEPAVTKTSPQNNNNKALLIFLDDSERDSAIGRANFGAASKAFLCAFVQQAGPIIVSASLIDNVRERIKPVETDAQKLYDRWQALMNDRSKNTDAETQEEKAIFLSTEDVFNKETASAWIIKKINDGLYLLLPKKYLSERDVSEKDVQAYTQEDVITTTEQKLGLKVNHMQTVADIDSIQKPMPTPPFVFYFMNSVWDEKNNVSSIFVTNAEYTKNNNGQLPNWLLVLFGHGLMSEMIGGLPIPIFQYWLHFLEYKINTKLLYYISCFGAGINSKIAYADMERGVDKTYSFAIITQALTDASIRSVVVDPVLRDGKLVLAAWIDYRDVVKKLEADEVINYKEIANLLGTKNLNDDLARLYFESVGVQSVLPHVKIPGLPWFSVVDTDRVCSMGSILAKTRTKPLNVETFCARKGKRAAPLGILLYALDVPFELIVNSKNPLGAAPAIVSMIPGSAIHHIRKLSSTVHTTEGLIQCFLQLGSLVVQKIFIIDEIEGKKEKANASDAQRVVIELAPQQNTVYYMRDGKLFKNITELATEEDMAKYNTLLALSQKTQVVISDELITQTQAKAKEAFAVKIDVNAAYRAVIKTLEEMPNGMVLRISALKGISCLPNQECWLAFLGTLVNYSSLGANKILWFDELELYNEQDETAIPFKNIIIDIEGGSTTLFATNVALGRMAKINLKTGMGHLQQDYVPKYLEILRFFDAHKQMPDRKKKDVATTQDLLTPEAIADVKKAQEQLMQKQEFEKRAYEREKNRPWWWAW